MTRSIDQLRQQLQTLQKRHERGELDADAWNQARAPLERELVALVVADNTAGAPAEALPDVIRQPGPSMTMTASVVSAIVLLAALGYSWTGSPRLALDGPPPRMAADTSAAPESTAAPTEAQVREMVERLAERLKEKPDDLVGQTMLARSYQVMGRHGEAITAFRKALSLAGNDAGLMVDLADALAANNNGDLTGEPTRLLERALAIEPTNLKVLALSGTAAFDRRDFAGAITQWEQVERALPRESAFLQQVQSSIALARQLGGQASAGTAAAAAASDVSGAVGEPVKGPAATGAAQAVSGTVMLAPALQAKVSAGDTLFVVARAANGPRMPLAVLRKQVKDLPLTFKLDDSMAMSAGAKISDHAEVIVVARISKSGDAMPQPGDISGQSAPVKPGASAVVIELADVVSTTPPR